MAEDASHLPGVDAATLGPMVQINFRLADGTHPVSADATQLELAILNLAINARDAMPGGGKLTISTTACTLKDDGELPPGDYIRIGVTDTGAGMTPVIVSPMPTGGCSRTEIGLPSRMVRVTLLPSSMVVDTR